MFEKIKNILMQMRKRKPVILNMTNYVTMDFVANGLLGIGASPVMSNAKQELEDLINIASAVVINLGTLSDEFIALSNHACQLANTLNKPIIFDPVGAGASKYRTETYLHMLENYKIAIIRGNASEIMALSDASIKTKGVDSTQNTDSAIHSAQALAIKYGLTVVISGQTDVIVDDKRVSQYSYGSSLMPMVTGSGCLLTAVIAAFHAIEDDRFEASSAATAFYGKCGEHAAQIAKGSGSFKHHFIDALNRDGAE